MKTAFLCLALCLTCGMASAQVFVEPEKTVYNADSVRAVLEDMPYFTVFKDNYLIGGTTVGETPTSKNSDVKFQLSVSQRITKSKLPFDTYLFLQYTQRAYWNVFQNSLPIRDLNFNPGLGIGHLIVYKNKYIGRGYLMIEHESNGKDSLESRSWNKVSLGATIVLGNNVDVQAKAWYPIVDGRRNKDILDYAGLFQFGGSYRTNNDRFQLGLLFVKRKTWRMNFNSQVELSYKLNKNENHYLFLQYYNGYGENLLEYNRFHSKIRFGFVIKPHRNFSTY